MDSAPRFSSARVARHRQLITGSSVLVLGAAVQAITGSLFWLVSAQFDKQADVGSATKLFTSVLFVTYLAGLGLPVALARYAPDRDRDSQVVFTWSAIITVISATVLGGAYVAAFELTDIFESSATEVLTDFDSILGPLLFVVAVAGAALSMIVDVRCMTARRWNLVLARITIVGVVRIPLLFLLRDGEHRALWLFVFAVGPVAASGILGAIFAPKLAEGRHRLGPKPAAAREAARYSFVNYVSTLAYQAPYFALPVIVLTSVSEDAYASFYIAWGVVGLAFYVPTAIGQALLAEGGRDGARVYSQVKLAMLLALGLMVGGAIVSYLGKDLITTFYGEEYDDAARVLPVMMAAGIPWAISSLLLSEARVLHRHVATVAITLTLTVAIVIPALRLVPIDGIDGASRAWFIGNVVAAGVAVIFTLAGRMRAAGEQQAAPPPRPTSDGGGAEFATEPPPLSADRVGVPSSSQS
jgi:O-antigen/teichoic acid export membrane protein